MHYGIGFRKIWVFNEPINRVTPLRPFMMQCPTYVLLIQVLGHVKWRVVTEYFALYEPELIHQRKACRLRRRRFWAAGVNDLFTVDQHDKWLKFGLGLHTGIEPFSGRIMWIWVWHSNQNPQLILSYYLNMLEALGHMPMVTQSNPGSENYGIANAHTMLRQWHNPSLHGTLQHRWMQSKKNVMPEIAWMVFHWIFIPWLQQELDAYQDCVHNTAKQHDCNKILPHGVPNLIYDSSEDFGALDFKIKIECEALDHVQNIYIKPSHCMFDLVPEAFGRCIQCCYDELGHPVVTWQSAWNIYLLLLCTLQMADELLHQIQLLDDDEDDEDFVPLLDDYQDLPSHKEPNGTYYMGGVGGGLGLDTEHLHQLDSLTDNDEPNITLGIDEDLVGLDHAGLVVWEFSDCESEDEMVNEW
ncbi:uncharacterized protein EDB93DRAFT_1108909 [Suillus bovinus]|uniref:uncharacterized protein n=1 Tax=Suillus bovinus TaxID=48563 RepID=UPI001B86F197|nr:uncharacterized protein EDB93DRAFT_1108909 [Suillus bovinus]KAG2128767.1 hypothetical protein EDB93DRAFT_1108909 [Suillus bovinus]